MERDIEGGRRERNGKERERETSRHRKWMEEGEETKSMSIERIGGEERERSKVGEIEEGKREEGNGGKMGRGRVAAFSFSGGCFWEVSDQTLSPTPSKKWREIRANLITQRFF